MKITVKCQYCEKNVVLPFRCRFCSQHYCTEHRLPENHECPEYWKVTVPREQPSPFVVEEGLAATPYEYTFSYTPPRVSRPFRFSQKELRHLTIGALLVIGVGLSFIPQAVRALGLTMLTTPVLLLSLALILTFSFLIHEIAHKLSAQHFGLWAEFRLTLFGALITFLSMLLPFKIISPGAVMIAGPLTKEEAGKTAITGPLTNIVLSTICIIVLEITQNPFLMVNSFFGAWINALIALFNIIPFGIMDGFKVFQWNKLAWTTAFIASIALTFFIYFGFT